MNDFYVGLSKTKRKLGSALFWVFWLTNEDQRWECSRSVWQNGSVIIMRIDAYRARKSRVEKTRDGVQCRPCDLVLSWVPSMLLLGGKKIGRECIFALGESKPLCFCSDFAVEGPQHLTFPIMPDMHRFLQGGPGYFLLPSLPHLETCLVLSHFRLLTSSFLQTHEVSWRLPPFCTCFCLCLYVGFCVDMCWWMGGGVGRYRWTVQ